jgi:D-inositol-3-phosphate glycosyltransferase
VRVVVLTTSYPRDEGDVAGLFVADAVQGIRERGVTVDVVSPRDFAHFGIAYGAGVVGNLRASPAKAALLPAMMATYSRAARAAARGADLVHAHWLPSGIAALATGRPYVLQVWGTDVELARRAPWLARPVLRRARLVIAASSALAASARELGARRVVVVPGGVELPADPGEPVNPPHVLYAGRLSPEKGVLELVEAARGLELVVAGDGPLRARVPEALGFVAHGELERLYRRAAVVVCPSRREGFGVVAAEAAAFARPVVASAVGGLLDIVEDGVTGLLVPPRDPGALRAALLRLLSDGPLRRRLGAAARERAEARFSREVTTTQLLRVYEEALAA